jgi:hypothetical protein
VFEIALGEPSIQFRFIPVRLSGWHLTMLSGREAEDVRSRMFELSSIFPHSIFTTKEMR